MSRYCLAHRLTLAVVVCWGATALPSIATAQGSKPARVSVYEMLTAEIDTKDYQEPMALREFLGYLHKQLAAKGVDAPILVDVDAFWAGDERQPNGPLEDEVRFRFQAGRTRMSTAEALQLAIGQIKSKDGAYYVRKGTIVITTQEDAGLSGRLQQPVVARFDKTPFREVVRQLVDLTGAAILIDPRLHEKVQAPITAELSGNVSLAAILPVICDMAELRFVRVSVPTSRRSRRPEAAAAAAGAAITAVALRTAADEYPSDAGALSLDECLYVTTPANAELLETRLRQRHPADAPGPGGLMAVPGAGVIIGSVDGGTGMGRNTGSGLGTLGLPMPGFQQSKPRATNQPPATTKPKTVAPDLTQLQAEIAALRAEVTRLRQTQTAPRKEEK